MWSESVNVLASTTKSKGFGDDFDDERPGGDPAGATFEETLEEPSCVN